MKRTILVLLTAWMASVGCFEDRGRSYPQRPTRWVCSPHDASGSPAPDPSDPSDPGGPDVDPPPGPSCPVPSCPSGLDAMYISGDPVACAAIDFSCPEGEQRFDAPCGCGCEPTPPPSMPGEPGDPSGGDEAGPCPDPGQSGAFYVNDACSNCKEIEFTCPEGQERFDGPCGTGCWDRCPEVDDPRVHYLSEDREICELIEFRCPADCVAFDDRCGCGCIEPEVTGACPDPDDPDVLYVSTSTTVCARVDLACPGDAFDDACGCGCLSDP